MNDLFYSHNSYITYTYILLLSFHPINPNNSQQLYWLETQILFHQFIDFLQLFFSFFSFLPNFINIKKRTKITQIQWLFYMN